MNDLRMAFSKQGNSKEVSVEVTHRWHPGALFVFHFPKRLPQSALDAEKSFLGLKDDERAEAHRAALVNTVAEMVTREPEGFDDFPETVCVGPGTAAVSKNVADRVRVYFDDPEQPELEAIIVSAWRAYRAAAIPAAYTKSAEGRSA